MSIIGLIFALIVCVVGVLLIGLGIGVGLVASVAAAILAGLGILATSIWIGVRTGRPSAGVRAFLLQSGIVAGIPAGAVGLWLAHQAWAGVGDAWSLLLCGSLGGALAGASIALLLDGLLRWFTRWASQRGELLRSRGQSMIELTFSRVRAVSQTRGW